MVDNKKKTKKKKNIVTKLTGLVGQVTGIYVSAVVASDPFKPNKILDILMQNAPLRWVASTQPGF